MTKKELVHKIKETIINGIEQKAVELVDKYYWIFGDGYLGHMHIQCALIAVDELLLDTDASSPFEELRLKFWQEVKSEIGKL